MHLSVSLELEAGARLEVYEHGAVTFAHARQVHHLAGFATAVDCDRIHGSSEDLVNRTFDPRGMYPRVADGAGTRVLPLRVVAVHDSVAVRDRVHVAGRGFRA